MAEGRELSVILSLQDKEALSRLHTALKGIENQTKQSAKTMSMNWTELAAKFYLVQNALRPVINFMSEAIESAARQEDAINRLNVALAAQGLNVGVVSQAYQRMATEMQRSTRFGDEAIMEVQQQLTTFGKVAPESMQRVTQAVLDLATAKKIDLRAATDLMSKAAVGETGTLSRYGIIIDQTIPKTQKFAEVLKLIEERMGGAAQRDTETYSGAVEQLKNAYGDFLEEIGNFIIKNDAVIAGIKGTTAALNGLIDLIKNNKDEVNDFFSAGILAGAPGAGADIGQELLERIKAMPAALSGVFGGLASTLSGQGQTLIDALFGDNEAQAAAIDQAQITAQTIANNAVQSAALAREAIHQNLIDSFQKQEQLSEESRNKLLLQQAQSTEYFKRLKNEETLHAINSELAYLKAKGKLSEQELKLQQSLEEAKFKLEMAVLQARYKAQIAFASATADVLTALASLTGNSMFSTVALVIQTIVQAIQTILTAIAFARAAAWDWAGAAAVMASVAALISITAQTITSLQSTKSSFDQNIGEAGKNFLSSVPDFGKLNIPGAAVGGMVSLPGSVLVGERGPEILNLPSGATITPLPSKNGGINFYVTVNIYNPIVSTQEIAEKLGLDIGRVASEFIATELERL